MDFSNLTYQKFNIVEVLLLGCGCAAMLCSIVVAICWIWFKVINHLSTRSEKSKSKKQAVNIFKKDSEIKDLKDAVGGFVIVLVVISAICLFTHGL